MRRRARKEHASGKQPEPLRDDIAAAAAAMDYKIGMAGLIRTLDASLEPGERVRAMSYCSGMPTNVLLVVTGTRLLTHAGPGSRRNQDIPLVTIRRVQTVTPLIGLGFSTVLVDAARGRRRFKILQARRLKTALDAARNDAH